VRSYCPDLVDGLGAPRQLVVVSAKDEAIYIAERSNMGKFSRITINALYQQISGALPGGTWSMPAFFNNTLYYGPVGSPILAFPFQKCPANCEFFPITVQLRLSRSDAQHLRQWSKQRHRLGRRGCRNHYDDLDASHSAALHAYAATNLANELYNNYQVSDRDLIGPGNKFALPMIASARVYVGTATGVGVFGVLDQSVLTPLQQWRNTYFGNPSDVWSRRKLSQSDG